MLPRLDEIKNKRKKVGISQSELAKKSGVSQSFIAKIESRKIDPSYASVGKILSSLDSLESKNMLCAKNVMSKKVATIECTEKVCKGITLMKKLGVSQIPVTSKGLVVGSISEKAVLEKMIDLEDTNLSGLIIKEIMDDAFPTLGEDMPLSTILTLLRYNQAVLVTKKERILGIITKANLLSVA